MKINNTAPIYCVALLGIALALAIAFETGHLLPASTGILLLYGVAIWGLWQTRLSANSALTRLMILLYFLPFLTCLGYVFDPNYTWWYTPLAIRYMSNPVIVAGMLMVGLIGLVSLLAGMWLARASIPEYVDHLQTAKQIPTLHPFFFGALLFGALFFSYLNAPSETILTSIYSGATGLAGQFNFNASYLISYTLLIVLYVDVEREENQRLKRFKILSIFIVIGIILVFFQLLRGDRDSFGLVVGLTALYLSEPSHNREHQTPRKFNRFVLVGAIGVLVLTAFLAVGWLRGVAATGKQPSLAESVIKGATREATWTAVLLTNLSLSAQYHEGRMVTENGSTYLQYLLSLPPGFITHALGIERPIEMDHGPVSWFSDISAGGIHVVAVPFKNFHSWGVVVILALFGYLIGRSEMIGQSSHWLKRLWYGSFFVVSATWFWYSDMSLTREVMSFGIVAVVYALSCNVVKWWPIMKSPNSQKG